MMEKLNFFFIEQISCIANYRCSLTDREPVHGTRASAATSEFELLYYEIIGLIRTKILRNNLLLPKASRSKKKKNDKSIEVNHLFFLNIK